MSSLDYFKMTALTEIMRQKNDKAFTALLNRLRTGSHTEHDIQVLNSRCITTSDSNYPSDALHIWAENTPVDEHNQKKLESIQSPLIILKAKDQYPKNVNKQYIDKVLARGRSETGGLSFEIRIKEGARIMLTTNNLQDRLINGQMGTVIKIDLNGNNDPNVVYVKFDDSKAGKTAINTSPKSFARENHLVPIEPVLAKIKIRPGKASSLTKKSNWIQLEFQLEFGIPIGIPIGSNRNGIPIRIPIGIPIGIPMGSPKGKKFQ